MKTYDLGYMNEKAANRIFTALDGKSFMNFRVSRGISPGGINVELSTDYPADGNSDVEILTFALHIVAHN